MDEIVTDTPLLVNKYSVRFVLHLLSWNALQDAVLSQEEATPATIGKMHKR